MAKVYTGQRVFLSRLCPARALALPLFGVDATREQDWKPYAKSLIIFSLVGW